MTRYSFDDGDFWQPPVDRRAVTNREFIRAGIGVDRPPAHVDPRNSGWQSVCSWPEQRAALHRCDEHPRLERLLQLGSPTTYYLNGKAMASFEAAIAALPAAEERSLYPGHGETYLTYEPPTLHNSDLPEGGESEVDDAGELESLEAMRHGES